MIKDFEGKTEQEAIAKAMASLGLEQDEFDVEILETTKGGIFKKGSVKIRVHVGGKAPESRDRYGEDLPAYEADPELELHIMGFLETCIDKIGCDSKVTLLEREENKIILNIQTNDPNMVIGKHGKNLDALQLLANVFAGKMLGGDQKILKVVLDSENYRNRREETLVRMATKTAQQVQKTRESRLLEPMNPFERRLVHTALGTMRGITTESEGEGLIKQIRVQYTGD